MKQRPEEIGIGRAYRQARGSLFLLLVVIVLLGLWGGAFLSWLWLVVPELTSRIWWIGLGGLVLIGFFLISVSIRWDDRRISRDETRIELLLPYMIRANKQIRLGGRESYSITKTAQAAWQSCYQTKAPMFEQGKSFQKIIFTEHMELMRHLVVFCVASFGKSRLPKEALHSWWPSSVPVDEIPWDSLSSLIRENRFSRSMGRARPTKLRLPPKARIEAYDKGPVLLRISWRSCPGRGSRLLAAIFYRPGGEIVVRCMGLSSEVSGKGYEHMTARLNKDQPSQAKVHVLSTRLVVEVETRWNFLNKVADFRDWAMQLSHHLKTHMDYWSWRDSYLERTIDDLDWKIGWIEKNKEPRLAERLEKIEARLDELAARGEPGSPVQQDSS